MAKEIETEAFGKIIPLPKVKELQVVALMNTPRNANGEIIWDVPTETPPAKTLGEFVTSMANNRGELKIVKIPKYPTMKESKEAGLHLRRLGGQYFEGSDGYYIISANGTPKQFTNFKLKIVAREEMVKFKNIIPHFKVEILQGAEKILFTIAEESYKVMDHFLEKKYPNCHIFTDSDSRAREYFKRILSILLEQGDFAKKQIYSFWGWGELSKNGTRNFHHGGNADCIEKKCLPKVCDPEERRCILQKALNIFSVGPKEVIYPLFIYGAAAYMDAIFTDAGHPLAHCVMAIAKSGSLKTSLFKEIYAPFTPKEERIFTVRSTAASINVLHEYAYDDILVIDDFNLEGSNKEVTAKLKNLRDLIRIYGDKTPRAKYGGNDDIKQYKVRGGCVITGEEAMSGELQSSAVRYLKIIFPGKLNGDCLKEIQDDPTIMPVFFGEFIRYLERNYAVLVSKTKAMFDAGRSRYQGLEFSRLCDALLHMLITANTIADFLVESNALTSDAASNWKSDFESVMCSIILEQDKNAAPLEPHVLYIRAVWDMLGTGKIRIAPTPEAYQKNLENYVGYMESDLYMLEKTEIFKAVCGYFDSQRDYFPMGADEVSKVLKERGLTKCDSSGCLKRSSLKIQGRPRMLGLRKDLCENLLNMGEEYNV